MKNRCIVVLSTAIILCIASIAGATDRDAKMIDSLGFTGSSFSGGTLVGLTAEGENTVATADKKWAVVAGVNFGKETFANYADPLFLGLSLGLKYYLFDTTSFTVLGSYTINDWARSPEGVAGALRFKQRLISAARPISPYLSLEARARSRSVDTTTFSDVVGTLGAGCDFLMREDMAFVFEGAYFVTQGLGGAPEEWSGFIGTLGLKYYWY
ncbi:MAG: hypothetical protein HQ559_16260 [Lentisphaerae bacterium]|nr:hypothetical protein [Lentisphaerota bacterium]